LLCQRGTKCGCPPNSNGMKIVCLFAAMLTAASLGAQSRHEVGLTLGRISGPDRGVVSLGGGTALQANYGVRLAGGEKAALLGEVHFLANPQRVIASANRAATRDVASLYVTPGVRVKFLPTQRVSPWLAVGGGYALHEHSVLNIGGSANAAPRTASTGAFQFGGGVDAGLTRWLAVRFEVRDFVTGSPKYNAGVSGSQHNVVTGGGVVLRF
jgi:opacity protein-like surface antigen